MARKLYYKIIDNQHNHVTDQEWDDVLRLQHWYNSEFIWTAGKLGMKMFTVFPNSDLTRRNFKELQSLIHRRHRELRDKGLTENASILQLESEGLIVAQKGGYLDACLASGFTRVADNEFNAYLVCEFLLKTSILIQNAVITAYDEGNFIKPKNINFQRGKIILPVTDDKKLLLYRKMTQNRHVFAVVDPTKYDHHPNLKNTIPDFTQLEHEEQQSILKNWNWLGFGNNYDLDGDDVRGYDLNKKVFDMQIEILPKTP